VHFVQRHFVQGVGGKAFGLVGTAVIAWPHQAFQRKPKALSAFNNVLFQIVHGWILGIVAGSWDVRQDKKALIVGKTRSSRLKRGGSEPIS